MKPVYHCSKKDALDENSKDESGHFNYRFNIPGASLHYQPTALFSQQRKQSWPKINRKIYTLDRSISELIPCCLH
jgi:hypothetical protein